jgi:hypothetical protein
MRAVTAGSAALELGARPRGHIIADLPADDIDRLSSLWRELLEHHLAAAPHLAAVGTGRTWSVTRSHGCPGQGLIADFDQIRAKTSPETVKTWRGRR